MNSLKGILSECLTNLSVPSLGAAILLEGKLFDLNAVGVRKQGKDVQVQPSDKYHLGYCSMAMTATLVARLVDKGKLAWNTRVTEVFSHLVIHTDYESVTLKQLLNHNAGWLPPVDENLWQHLGNETATQQRLGLVKNILKRPFIHQSEYGFEYSDPNYLLVGVILEIVTGKSFENLLIEELFKPLGMSTAGFGTPAKSSEVDQPFGHNPDPVDPLFYGDDPKALSPVGITHCSLEDWATFARLHLVKQPTDFISAESFAQLHGASEDRDHAMGWAINKNHPKAGRVLWLGSGNTMFFAMICLYLELKASLMVVTNMGGQSGEEACLTTMLQLEQHYL